MATIRLNKQNYFHNLNECLKRVESLDKLIVVLKNNAYGHGYLEIGNLAKEFGIKYIAVKNAFEANILKDKFENILILSQLPQYYEPKPNYVLAVNDLCYFNYLKPNTNIALKLDTNMHRSGITQDNLEEAIKIIKDKKLNLISAFTHYSSMQNIKNQKPLYIKMCDYISSNFGHEIFFHSANSSTLFLGENDYDKAARVGIAQFGYCDTNANLKPVLSLWANKISSRIVNIGDSIGYDEVFISDKKLNVANYDLGYADGMLYYKGVGNICLADDKTPILGKISMDSFSTYNIDDEICVFDDALKFARYFNTNVYECLVRLNCNIKKEIV